MLRRIVFSLAVIAAAACSSPIGPIDDHEPTGGNHEPTGGNHEPTGGNHEPTGGNANG